MSHTKFRKRQEIAIILAAGSARRLSPLTDNRHKCLLEIGDQSILEYQLDALDQYGVGQVVIVVGFLKEQIIAKFGDQYKNLHITYVENKDYATTNTVYSLWLARNYFQHRDFLYFNADVLFHPALLGRLLNSNHGQVLGVEVKQCGAEEVKVIVDQQGRVLRIGKQLDLEQSLGEFVGIARFAAEMAPDFAKRLKAVVDEGDQKAFFEKALDRLLDKYKVFYTDITDIPAIEIDFPEDLQAAEKTVLPRICSFNP